MAVTGPGLRAIKGSKWRIQVWSDQKTKQAIDSLDPVVLGLPDSADRSDKVRALLASAIEACEGSPGTMRSLTQAHVDTLVDELIRQGWRKLDRTG